MSIVGYAAGAFDLFHIGHLNILKSAKSQCDLLIAGVVSDELLRSQKGIDPVVPLAERLEIVRNIRCVDEAHPAVLSDKLAIWRELRFDIFFKGDDWKGTEKGLRLERAFAKVGVEVVYFPYTASTSSTALRRALSNINLLADMRQRKLALDGHPAPFASAWPRVTLLETTVLADAGRRGFAALSRTIGRPPSARRH